MADTIGDLDEDQVIARFAAGGAVAGAEVVVPNGDDAAAWRSDPGEVSVITTDTLVEGVHFDFAWSSARDVGRKLIAVNLSDLAAMGARPRCALISVSLPAALPVARLEGIAAGSGERCSEAGVAIIGGNTTRIAGPLVLTATLIGGARQEAILRRGGSRPGDWLFVTGRLGDARGGLEIALGRRRGDPALIAALVDPPARVEAGLALAASGVVTGCCDVSDGLGRDLRRLLAASGHGARIDGGSLPISPALLALAGDREALGLALSGGEDYELLFTARPDAEAAVRAACAGASTPVTAIGVVSELATFEVAIDGAVLELPAGFQHFSNCAGVAGVF